MPAKWARVWFGVTALCVVAGVALSVVSAVHSEGHFPTGTERGFNTFAFFTIQSNLIVGGPTLLLAVAGFGAATIIFGLSRSFWLSLLMLFLLGGLDNISVVIRGTLALTRTPDDMRGRVAAINGLFVSASNQLGGFESGLTAQLFGPTLSVAFGGIGTILVVLFIAWVWPELRHLRTLRETAGEPT